VKRSDRFTSAAEAIARLGEWRGVRATAADLRALYAAQVGERPHSGFTFGDFEIPVPLRAMLAAMDGAAAVPGERAIEADAPSVTRREVSPAVGAPPRMPPTEIIATFGAAPPSGARTGASERAERSGPQHADRYAGRVRCVTGAALESTSDHRRRGRARDGCDGVDLAARRRVERGRVGAIERTCAARACSDRAR